MFLDEPFEGIDPVTSEAIRVQLRVVAQRGITVLLTSHILSMVDRIADQIIMIRQGRIVWNSPLAELPRGVEELYFDLVESAATEIWLGWDNRSNGAGCRGNPGRRTRNLPRTAQPAVHHGTEFFFLCCWWPTSRPRARSSLA